MSKRKLEQGDETQQAALATNGTASKIAKTNGHLDVKTPGPNIQIITGSYERALHGITASISQLVSSSEKVSPDAPLVQFADTFLFNAHASAIRCLALSPFPGQDASDNQGVYLATGGSDERINVYSLAAAPLADTDKLPSMPVLGNNKVSENPRNRELGTLLQHSSNITALHFPSRSKLLSASEDNTISVSRVRDLTRVSTITAPRPKAQGQPSGDTAPVGATPAGVNDFAVHPSMKLMVSVGRGERCMRLWNLVTGKKAGVLNFSKDNLQAIRESKYSSGEGRRIRWSAAGTEFAVSFERGVLVFGEDSKPKCKLLPMPLTKIHQISWVPDIADLLAVSTEDGRVIFYNTQLSPDMPGEVANAQHLPDAKVVAQVGGKDANLPGRVKDFKILRVGSADSQHDDAVIVTAGSDGVVRLWFLHLAELGAIRKEENGKPGGLIGTYETGNRITCLTAFVMLPQISEDVGLSEFEGLSDEDEDESSNSDRS